MKRHTVLSLESIRDALESVPSKREIARGAGVHYHTVRHIASGAEQNPKYRTVKLLSDYIRDRDRLTRRVRIRETDTP